MDFYFIGRAEAYQAMVGPNSILEWCIMHFRVVVILFSGPQFILFSKDSFLE